MEYTRFEKARILGARSLQLAMGAPALVSTKGMVRCLDVALKEYQEGVIPITIIKEAN
jgi:DNA-directed RNA polymerase subunit K